MEIIGKNLNAARKTANLTRKELASFAGLTVPRIWQMETMEFSKCNPHLAQAIAFRLNVTLNYLTEK